MTTCLICLSLDLAPSEFKCLHGWLDPFDQIEPRRCQAQFARGALQQADAQRVFQPLYLPAEPVGRYA